jgi:hypothetical protein
MNAPTTLIDTILSSCPASDRELRVTHRCHRGSLGFVDIRLWEDTGDGVLRASQRGVRVYARDIATVILGLRRAQAIMDAERQRRATESPRPRADAPGTGPEPSEGSKIDPGATSKDSPTTSAGADSTEKE